MSDTSKDGGPVVPLHDAGPTFGPGHNGIPLRDWFAGQALSGLVLDGNENVSIQYLANMAYIWADAMLAARDDPELFA